MAILIDIIQFRYVEVDLIVGILELEDYIIEEIETNKCIGYPLYNLIL